MKRPVRRSTSVCLEKFEIAGGDEPVIHVEDGNECADFAKGNVVDNEEALPLADDGVDNEMKDCRGDWLALGNPLPWLEGRPKQPVTLQTRISCSQIFIIACCALGFIPSSSRILR